MITESKCKECKWSNAETCRICRAEEIELRHDGQVIAQISSQGIKIQNELKLGLSKFSKN
jgi:hypothetical protein